MTTITPATTFATTGSFTTSPTYSGTFIPVLWSSKLNVKFYAASVFPAIANTDWQGEISNMGDKVVINLAPTITINNYTVGATLSYQVPTPSTSELAINKGKSFAFQVSDVLDYQAKPDLMNMFSNDASEQMRVAIDLDGLLGIWDGATATTNKGATAGAISAGYNMGTLTAPVTLTSSNVLQKILEMASVLDETNTPESDRWLLIDPLTRVLLMQSNLAQAQFMGDSTSMVRNGMIGKIDRFTVYVSNQLPKANTNFDFAGNANTSAKRRAIIAGHKSAVTFASQMVKMETLRNPNDFGDLVRGLQVYGYSVLNGNGMALLLAA